MSIEQLITDLTIVLEALRNDDTRDADIMLDDIIEDLKLSSLLDN